MLLYNFFNMNKNRHVNCLKRYTKTNGHKLFTIGKIDDSKI